MNIQFPLKVQPIFQPKRYKVLFGGRGAGKSHSVARALLIQGSEKPLRILCVREFQNSIRDSVHKLLSDQIVSMGLESFYTIELATIKGKNGTEFFFEGIRNNVNKIKSYEGINRVWAEEANLVSKNSWDVLIPTIRADNSEIWITFNPELEDDETYQRFVVNPPKNSLVIKMNWSDNPWFPEILKQEMEELKKRDYKAYLTVWEGECRKIVDGAIFGNELESAEKDGRISFAPYDKGYPVTVSWDLGYSDFTSLWFMQKIGEKINIIDCYQNHLQDISFFVTILQERGYVYDEDLLPHDANKTELGTGKAIIERLRALGRSCRVVDKLSIKERIDEARRFMAKCTFDKEKCREGLNALRRYRYLYNEQTGQFSRDPAHDVASHACLLGDTQVLTDNGLKRIDTIRPGDLVWTPEGYSTVEKAGVVKKTKELLKITTQEGDIVCTPEHKFFTNRGLVRADELLYTDKVWTQRNKWKSSDSSIIGFRDAVISSTGALGTGYGPKESFSVHSLMGNNPFFTRFFGKKTTELYHKDKNFSLKTAINSTLQQGTGVYEDEVNTETIHQNIHTKYLMDESIIAALTMGISQISTRTRSCTESSGSRLMARYQKVTTSITKTVTYLIMLLRTLSVYQLVTTPNTMQKQTSGLVARLIENSYGKPKSLQKSGILLKKGISGILQTQRKFGRKGSGLLRSVLNVTESTKRRIRNEQSGVTRIARKQPYVVEGGGRLVYDLTVKKHHCYLANGLLVSNSDSFCYLAVGQQDKKGVLYKHANRLKDQIRRSKHSAVIR